MYVLRIFVVCLYHGGWALRARGLHSVRFEGVVLPFHIASA